MEKFVVSARKYRPQNFNTVVGQSHITTTLKNAINNNQLAHAFLFCGPRGVGKTTCARILAKTINCENRTPDGEACNTCNSCTSFDNGSSLNIHELDAASNNSVDDIRVLIEQVRFAPQAGAYKVYIVDEVHMLSAQAFNAFLKTLEEPPAHAIFILATTEKHKILPTILSRCQIFDFKRITNSDTLEHLQDICKKESIEVEKTALHVIAQKSEGCMRDALSIMDKIASFTDGKISYANTLEHLNILDEDYFFTLLDHMRSQNLSDALLLYDTINNKGFEADTVLDGFTEFVRNLLVSKDKKAAVLLEVADDFKDRYATSAAAISANWLIATLNLLSDAHIQIKQSRNKKLFVEMLLIKLCYLDQAIQLVENDNGDLVKKKRTETAKPVAFKALPIIRMKAALDVALPNLKQPTTAPEPPKQAQVASLQIQEALPVPKTAVADAPPVTSTRIRKNSLDSVRQKIIEKNESSIGPRAITDELLMKAWETFISSLEKTKNYSAMSAFQSAKLSIENDQAFIITVSTTFIAKFIEEERVNLSHHLQKYFNNRFLKYKLNVVEDPNEIVPETKHFTQREQYDLLVSKYPMIKTLREKLKLELGF